MIHLDAIGHVYPPETRALDPMNLELADGVAYALLGPSGCGKTTLLNIISGLLTPSEGRVRFGERDVTNLPPHARNIAQVFQFPVVYDTMTVYENLAFPLRNRGIRDVDARVHKIGELLDLTEHLTVRARGLGPDAKQRISLARGLVREDVVAVLLDEPLTVIDPHARWLLRRKLKTLHAELSVTWVYVTHDQEEALTFADEVIVMNQARIVQRATPEELFERPDDAFVGHFIGNPGMMFLPCTRRGDTVRVGDVELPIAAARARTLPENTALELGIRPEHAELSEPGSGAELAVELRSVQDRGSYRLVEVAIGPAVLSVRTDALEIPESVALRLPDEWVHFYENGRRISA